MQQVERDIMTVVSFIVKKTDLYTMTGVIPRSMSLGDVFVEPLELVTISHITL